jgi:hypothetical protein
MKTAMQELIDKIKEAVPYFKMSIYQENFDKALQKEKEQILNARLNGFMISAEGWNGEYPEMKYTEMIREIKNEEYYNETYNQNK